MLDYFGFDPNDQHCARTLSVLIIIFFLLFFFVLQSEKLDAIRLALTASQLKKKGGFVLHTQRDNIVQRPEILFK